MHCAAWKAKGRVQKRRQNEISPTVAQQPNHDETFINPQKASAEVACMLRKYYGVCMMGLEPENQGVRLKY